MRVLEDQSFKDLTTLRLGGNISKLVEIETPSEIQEFIDEFYDEEKFILGGGSNLVVSDDEFAGVVAKINLRNSSIATKDSDRIVRAEAGINWDEFVDEMVDNGFTGLETLSGIPGLIGAAPIQNIGAYGQEVASLIEHVNVVDLNTGKWRKLEKKDLGFGYRTSLLKQMNVIVESVEFKLKASKISDLTTYKDIAEFLEVSPGTQVPIKDIRNAVLAVRQAKGMVLDSADFDTWSVGSFFTNPIVEIEKIPQGAISFPVDEVRAKVSAAWLIENAGFAKGFAQNGVAISSKHSLALTNRGSGTTKELLSLAKQIQDEVIAKYGINLEVEPTLFGVTL